MRKSGRPTRFQRICRQWWSLRRKPMRSIKERWGIDVEHYRAKESYESQFYRIRRNKARNAEQIYGFPIVKGAWCNSKLKMQALRSMNLNHNVSYVGIAVDEPKRLHNLSEIKRSPLVEAGWTEAMCREWCEKNDLLSPIYTTATRGGCWFCHNQGVGQLRNLRKNYLRTSLGFMLQKRWYRLEKK
mgnify:CR=1 FL=1